MRVFIRAKSKFLLVKNPILSAETQKTIDMEIHIDNPVQFDWEPGCAEDKLLVSMLKDEDIPHYFSFQVRHDHEVEFRLGVDRENETKTLELLKKFQDRLGNSTFFDIYGGENESFNYEPDWLSN